MKQHRLMQADFSVPASARLIGALQHLAVLRQ
jgi:hypothetical protein